MSRVASLIALCGLAASPALAFPVTAFSGHLDVLFGVEVENGELETEIEVELVASDPFFNVPGLPDGILETEDDGGVIETKGAIEPDQVIFNWGPATFDAVQGVWQAGSELAEGEIFFGWGAEEVELGVFEGDNATFEIIGVDGPGSFSVLVPGPGGTDTLGIGDLIDAPAAGANHFDLVFDAAGVYRVTVLASATIDSLATGEFEAFRGQAVSQQATLVFVVPAPGAAGLLGVVGIAAARRRR